ncbi:MAG: Spo0E family sporulation regulatory protein-aspartic acid phosphatase [Desulfitobacteriaceae bacterium]
MEKDLIESIEKLRMKMSEVAKDKSLVDPQVIEISQRLDVLINEHYALTRSIFIPAVAA